MVWLAECTGELEVSGMGILLRMDWLLRMDRLWAAGSEGRAERLGDLGEGIVVPDIPGEDDIRDALGGPIHGLPE
ncbi:hypothetical protein SCMU_34490 [Sinomonas cyclohexanicum]|uniref:Uncharacterized protein n=1 Tax=Sinomonas cyclohexanicum TaxID=322009 RepID=A0ABN6FPN3_SINCY|nr:hypothetical protein SCMU_34490 [Corynebacterium cyclohexanicum]